MSREFGSFLKSLQARAIDIRNSLEKLSFRAVHEASWPVLLKRFSVIAMQIQSLYEELFNTGVADLSGEKRLAAHSVLIPNLQNYDPTRTLRTKPLFEVEREESDNKHEFLRDQHIHFQDLELQIDEFNRRVLVLQQYFVLNAEATVGEKLAAGEPQSPSPA